MFEFSFHQKLSPIIHSAGTAFSIALHKSSMRRYIFPTKADRQLSQCTGEERNCPRLGFSFSLHDVFQSHVDSSQSLKLLRRTALEQFSQPNIILTLTLCAWNWICKTKMQVNHTSVIPCGYTDNRAVSQTFNCWSGQHGHLWCDYSWNLMKAVKS